MNHMLAMVVTIAALGVGCSSGSDPKDGSPLGVEGKGPAAPIDHPPVDPAKILKSAEVRRVSIQQLRKSLPIAFGLDHNGEEITWKLGNDIGLDRMSDSLGEADFIDTTEENMEPSPLYLKFMDDVARDVCNRALVTDLTKTAASERVILRHVEPVDTATTNASGIVDNVRYLKLRLHGVKVADDDAQTLSPLVELFTGAVDAAAAGEPAEEAHVTEGWRAVCVALVVSPEFHLY